MTVGEMIAVSRYVVEGEVVSVVAVDAETSVATIRVQNSIVGHAPNDIAIHHYPNLSVSPSFVVAEHCVFFVGQHRGRNVLVNGYAGKTCRTGVGIDLVYVAGVDPNIGWTEWLNFLRKQR